MSKTELKFLLKHSSIYGIGTVVSQAVGFLLLPLYTRFLTPEDYGVMSLVNITVDIVGLIVTLGVVNAMSRFYFDFDDQKSQNLVISSIYWVFFFISLIFLPLLYFFSASFSELIFKSTEYNELFIVAFLALFFNANVDIGMSYLRVRALSFKFIQVSVLRTLTLIGFNIYFIAYLQVGVIGIFYSSLIAAIIFGFILSVPILYNVKLSFSWHLSKDMIRFSFPLIFSNIFRIVVNQSDKYFINYFFSPFETGLYSIAQKIGQAIHSLITSPFLQTYIPRRFEIMKQENAKDVYASILKYYLVVIGFIGLLLSVFSYEIVRIMTTEEYFVTAKYIPLVVLSMIIFGMKYHFETGILINKQTKYIAVINGVSAILNIVLNFILIQKYTLWGALIASNISLLATTVLNYLISQKLYKINFDIAKTYLLFILIVSFYFISLLLNFSNLAYSISSKLILLTIFSFVLFIFNFIDKELINSAKLRFQNMVKYE